MIEARIAAGALAWIDTPFVWGQSVKGRGCDCKGLLAGVMRELGREEADSFYALFANYRVDRPVPSNLLLEGMQKLFEPAEIAPGRFLLLNYGGCPGHLAIATSEIRAVHAYPGGAGARVRERDLAVLFHKFPLHSVWKVRACP